MKTGFFKVKPGQQLPHDGRIYEADAVVELPEHVGQDVRDKVDPCNPAGKPRPEFAPLAQALQGARPHERISLLTRERETVQARLTEIDAAIAAEQAREEKPVIKGPEVARRPQSSATTKE